MKAPRIKENQSGLVSIVITMILMIVLSLIVLGFAQVARREQRQAVDRQLSTQAYYAAETGINDARRVLADTSATNPYSIAGGSTSKTTQCGSDGLTGSAFNTPDFGQVKGTLFQYTCLLINQAPTDVQTTISNDGPDFVVPIKTNPGISNLVVSWQQKDGGTTLPLTSPNDLPADNGAAWGDPNTTVPLLRVDLVDTTPPVSRESLSRNDFVAFLYPSSTGTLASQKVAYAQGTNSQSSASSGAIVAAYCGSVTPPGPKKCNATFTGLDTTHQYYMRIRSIYSDANLELSAPTGTVTHFIGAQAVIDSTGRANDVLKRIQVRVPISATPSSTSTVASSDMVPHYALQSGDTICKQYDLAPAPDSSTTC